MPRAARPARRRQLPSLVLLSLLPALLASCGIASSSDGEAIQVYSARTYGTENAFSAFTEETGIEVEFLNGSDAELRERLAAEGKDTQADVYLTVDVANLTLAAEDGLLQPAASDVLTEAVPASLRDPEGRWFGLSQRGRVLVYNKDAVDPSELSTYAALADPRWADGRLCLRTSTSAYTQSLVASMIANLGLDGARQVVEGWVANDPQIIENDVEILRTLAAGGCEVGITNHYYLARELAADPDFPVGLHWPNQETTGTHVNISGAGITAGADDVEGARRFLEWLATDGQERFLDGNFEYPVNPAVEPAPLLEQFGPLPADDIAVAEFGGFNDEALQLLTDAGYR